MPQNLTRMHSDYGSQAPGPGLAASSQLFALGAFFDGIGTVCKGDRLRLAVSVAKHGYFEFVAGLEFVDEGDDFFHVGDLLAVDLGDDVAAEADFDPFDRPGRVTAF